MRKIVIILLLCVACTLIACIDSDYDLSKITTDDISIGDNESEFIMPVAKINFTSQNICNSTEEDEISLKEIYEEVDLWLPKSVVESSEYIDIDKLINSDEFGEQYLNKLIHLINEEISSVKEQRDEIALHIATTYRNRFINLLWESDIENKEAIATTLENSTDEEAAELISQLIKKTKLDAFKVCYISKAKNIKPKNMRDIPIAEDQRHHKYFTINNFKMDLKICPDYTVDPYAKVLLSKVTL
jgi:hypothetical protein